MSQSNTASRAFVGTLADGDDGAIHLIAIEPGDGTLERIGSIPAGDAPSFQALHPDGQHLYSVNTVDEGAIAAFSIDTDDGGLTEINRASTVGAGPCHCSVDAAGEHVFVANYSGGSVAAFPLRDDGGIVAGGHVIEHEGSSVDPDRQNEPHPHSIVPGPDDRFVYVPDLGTDCIEVFRLDRDADELVPVDDGPGVVHEGAGPRHLAFHPTADYVYVANELDSTLSTFERDPDTGGLTEVEQVDTLLGGTPSDNYPAEVAVGPNGRYAYLSNRGHDSIARFDLETPSAPVLLDCTPCGDWPRHFAIGPQGDWLVTAHEHADDLDTFSVDPETGELERTNTSVTVPEPVCVTFYGDREP